MDLIKTIEEEDDINYESDESKEDEEDDLKKPQKKKKAAKKKLVKSDEFDSSFAFVTNQKEYMKDTWSDMSAYLRKKYKSTLNEKISKIRKERSATEDVDIAGKDDAHGESDDDLNEESDSDDNEWDDVKTKNKDNKNKKKKKEKELSDGKKGMVKIIEKSEEEAEYFDYDESATFQSMNLSRPLLKAIEFLRWGHPTPIQAATIPTALSGKDICGCAATGTGKTAAYMLPILERLLFRSAADPVTRVLVVVPTRELGVQVFQVCKQLAQYTTIDVALSVGGLDLRIQEAELRRNPDVVIATPGRLVDHIKNTPTFSLETIEVLILDEADRLLDECFMDQMKEIVKSCAPSRQTMLFSATMSDQVNELALVSLKSPVKIFVDSNKAVAWNLKQEFLRIRPTHESKQEPILAALLTRTFTDHVIVFIRTKQQCHRLHIALGLLGLRTAQLHGNMSQAQRLESLKMFKEEQIDILLTTDVAARGLDISGVQTVINFQLPDNLEQYIHRVGRTARAGRSGRSVTFATEQQRKLVREIVKNSNNPVKSRIIPSKVIEKYASKIEALEPDIVKVVEEEKAEREIAMLENRANRLQNELKNGPKDRAWIEKTKKKSTKSNNNNNDKEAAKGKKERKKRKLEGIEFDRGDQNTADFIVRSAKRARKPKKIRGNNGSYDFVHKPNQGFRVGGGKKKGGKK